MVGSKFGPTLPPQRLWTSSRVLLREVWDFRSHGRARAEYPIHPPSEFVRDLLREKKERIEAARIRDAILDGYQDAIHGRTVPYRGDLRRLLKKVAE